MEIPTLESLPQEALAHLFVVLSPSDAVSLCQASKRCAIIGTSNEVWRQRVVQRWPALYGSRAEVNALLRAAAQTGFKCEYLIPSFTVETDQAESEGDEFSGVRLFWREIFYITLRVDDAVQAVKVANAKISSAAARMAASRRGGRRARANDNNNAILMLANGIDSNNHYDTSLDFVKVSRLLGWMGEIISQIEVNELGMDLDGPTHKDITKVFSSFSNDLIKTFVALTFEVLVQLSRVQQSSLSALKALINHVNTIILSALLSSSRKNLQSVLPLMVRQMGRIAQNLSDTLAITTKYGIATEAGIEVLNPIFVSVGEWLVRAGDIVEGGLMSNPRPFANFLVDALMLFTKDVEPELWEKKLAEAQYLADADGAEQVGQSVHDENDKEKDIYGASFKMRGLQALDGIIDALFADVRTPGFVWGLYLAAIAKFRFVIERNHLDVNLSYTAMLRLLALVSKSCSTAILNDLDYVTSTIWSPALGPNADTTLKKTITMAIAQISHDAGDEAVAPFLPGLLQMLAPFTADPSVADYARDCMINLWNASDSVPKEQLVKIGSMFIQNAIVSIQQRSGEWSSAALSLASAASALGPDEFERYFTQSIECMFSIIMDSIVEKRAVDASRMIDAISAVLKSGPRNSSVSDLVTRFFVRMEDLISRNVISFSSRSILLAYSRCCPLLHPNAAGPIVDYVVPKIIEIAKEPIRRQEGQDMAAFDDENYDPVIVGGQLIALHRGDVAKRSAATDVLASLSEDCFMHLYPKHFEEILNTSMMLLRTMSTVDDVGVSAVIVIALIEGLVKLHPADDIPPAVVARVQSMLNQLLQVTREKVADPSQAEQLSALLDSLTEIFTKLPAKFPIEIDWMALRDMLTEAARVAVQLATDIRQRPDDHLGGANDLLAEEGGSDDENEGGAGPQNLEQLAIADAAEDAAEGDDEEEPELTEQDYEMHTEVVRNVCVSAYHLVSATLKISPTLLQSFQQTTSWHADNIIRDPVGAQFALCIIVSMVEQITDEPKAVNTALLEEALPVYIPLLFDGCQSPSPFVSQAAVCGIGRLAGAFPKQMSEHVGAAIENLTSVWTYDVAQSEKDRWGPVLDNVSSSCGRILVAFPADSLELNSYQRTDLFKIYAENIPFSYDLAENDYAAMTLADLVERDDPVLTTNASFIWQRLSKFQELLEKAAVGADASLQQRLARALEKLALKVNIGSDDSKLDGQYFFKFDGFQKL